MSVSSIIRSFFSSSILLLIVFLSTPSSAAGKLKYGKYFGAIQMDGSSEQIATVADVYVVQPVEATDFPRLNVILRTNLGNFFSSEYVGYRFETTSYSFEKDILYLSDPNLDLAATLQVTSTEDGTILEGAIVHGPSQKKGRLRLEMPEDLTTLSAKVGFGLPFLDSLQGEYWGKCENKISVLQIETGRQTSISRAANSGLSGYVVTGRLGYQDDEICKGLCAYRFFNSADYRFFEGELLLRGARAAMNCSRAGDTLQCRHQMLGSPENCTYKKAPLPFVPPTIYPRHFFLKVDPEQKKPLPEPNPPANNALLDALSGDYHGFLHHENRDEYQLVDFNVVATSSTENLHVQNRVYITSSLSLKMGDSWKSTSKFGQQFSRRPFYIRPYYVVEAPNTDTFLVIEEWKKEYIRGVWYSKEFGRVGTLELVKGKVPEIPPDIKLSVGIDGEYEGPTDWGPGTNLFWWLKLALPGQIPREKRNTSLVQGEFESSAGILQGRAFESASFDMYTGAISFLEAEDFNARLVTGRLLPTKDLKLIWPSASRFGVYIDGYAPYTFRRLAKPR